MVKRKIVLVARDAAPSECFVRLAFKLVPDIAWQVNAFVGRGKSIPWDLDIVTTYAQKTNIVLLGMSSSRELAEYEIAAGQAARAAGVPYGFYGDAPRCWARARPGAWFEPLAADAAFYFGISQADADYARSVFPNAVCVGTGNPLREEMAFPKFTREEVRAKLEIAPETKLILVPGGKFTAGNMTTLALVIDAVIAISSLQTNVCILFAPHPGDRVPYLRDSETHESANLYEELMASSSVPIRLIPKEMLSISDLVPAADIVIEFGSSIGIEAAYQGVPVITLALEILYTRLERRSGSRVLEAVQEGLSVRATDRQGLAEHIETLLTPEGFAPMRARQLLACPKPTERGAALQMMVREIDRILCPSLPV